MAKLTNVRERVHQPFRDTLIRTSGLYPSSVQDRTDLFTQAGKDDAQSNLKNGSTLPSDQSMVVLALRVFTWFRNSVNRPPLTECDRSSSILLANGDVGSGGKFDCAQTAALLNGSAGGNYRDVYRLHWQSEEQLLWSFGSGQKFSLQSMPTAYFPYGGGLFGDMGHAGANCCTQTLLSAEYPSLLPVIKTTALCCPTEFRFTWGQGEVGTPFYLIEFFRQETGAWETAAEDTDASFPTTVSVGGEGFQCFDVTLPALGENQVNVVVVRLGDAGGAGNQCRPLIHWENGTPDHTGILRLARAILLPPRQNVLCQAQIVSLPDGGNGSVFGSTQGPRNMLSLTSNLNALDAVQKVISFTFDGLFSRDVQ